jgi:glycosyltransferase involved in cell wall biosynthesis
MRVLFVTYLEFPLEIGGFQNQVRCIADKLTEQGVEVDWYHIDSCDIQQYDIIHVFSSVPSLYPIIKKGCDLNIPIVLTPMLGSRNRSNRYYKIVMRLSAIPHFFSEYRYLKPILSSVSHITPLTEFEKTRICELADIPESKVTPIPNGIADAFFDSEIEEVELPFSQYMLVVGRIEKNKNQKTIIKIANSQNMNLLIVGEPGIGEKRYFEECKRMAGSNIFFWGRETNLHRLKFLYKMAAVTVIPSFSEMVPLVVYESLKMKTPVVCTDRCSLATEKTPGLFISDISEKELSNNIESSIVYLSETIGNCGIYSWADIAQKYLNVYNNLIQNVLC